MIFVIFFVANVKVTLKEYESYIHCRGFIVQL